MTKKKTAPPVRRSAKVKANPAPASVVEPSGFYVKVPLSPELAQLVSGHVARATEIAGTIRDLLEIAGECAEAVARERAELERTARKLRSRR